MTDQTFGTFRKKPVVIEAVQFTRRFAWPDWFHDAVSAKTITTHGTGKFADPGKPCFCEIHTLEGDMRGDEGDWIIKGVKGELYPCKPDIFAMTYEAATPAPAQPEGAQEDEPVAWRIAASTVLPVGELTAIKGRADLAKHLGYAVEPLYLHPSQPAGAAAPVEGAASLRQFVEDIARDPDEHPELRQKARAALAAAPKEKP